MKKRTALIIGIVIVVAIIGGGVIMFGGLFAGLFQVLRGDIDLQEGMVDYHSEIVTVTRGNLDDSIRVLGYVQSPTKASLSFNVDSGKIAEVFVQPGEQIQAGDSVARLDTSELEEAVDKAEKKLAQAEKELEEAEQPPSETDLAEKRLAIQQAETRLDEAKSALDKLKDIDLSQLRDDVIVAQEGLESAQIAYDQLLREDPQEQISPIEYRYAPAANKCAELSAKAAPNVEDIHLRWLVCNEAMDGLDSIARIRLGHARDIMQAEYAIVKARRVLKGAQEALEEVEAGPDPLKLSQAEYAIAEAEANLSQAKEALEGALAGPGEKELAAKEANVKRARIALEYAQDELKNATLRAPISGRITIVNVVAGDRVNSRTTVAEMADFDDLRVQADVDETQIPRIEEGQTVRVTIDGLPDETFQGRVHTIPLQGKLSSGVVVYPVSILLDQVPPGLRLGMTAEVEFIIESVQDVLLVPTAAIRSLPNGEAVTVMKEDPSSGGRFPERCYVKTGRTNGIFTEIIEGLSEGEQVEVRYEIPQNQFPF